MKLAVFGQRGIGNEGTVVDKLLDLINLKKWFSESITFLYGGAKGPQSMARGILGQYHDTVIFQPWTMVTNKIGKFTVDMFDWRNKQILDNADEVVIYDDGTPDREVDYVLHYVRRHNISYHIIKM